MQFFLGKPYVLTTRDALLRFSLGYMFLQEITETPE